MLSLPKIFKQLSIAMTRDEVEAFITLGESQKGMAGFRLYPNGIAFLNKDNKRVGFWDAPTSALPVLDKIMKQQIKKLAKELI